MATTDSGNLETTRATSNACRCGCSRTVRRTFAQGHDQILLAELRHKVSVGEMTSDAALATAAEISQSFGQKVARSLAIVAQEKARAAGRGHAKAA